MRAFSTSSSAGYSGLRGTLRSRDRREIGLGIAFAVSLVTGVTIWDALALHLEPVTWAGLAAIAASGIICVVLLACARRRWPLLLCAVGIVSIRLASPYIASAPGGDVLLLADCFAVCISLAAIAFRQETTNLFRRIRELLRLSPEDALRTPGNAIPATPTAATVAGD